jgi:hypothetical protein
MLAIDWIKKKFSLNYVIHCYVMTMEKIFGLIQGYIQKQLW